MFVSLRGKTIYLFLMFVCMTLCVYMIGLVQPSHKSSINCISNYNSVDLADYESFSCTEAYAPNMALACAIDFQESNVDWVRMNIRVGVSTGTDNSFVYQIKYNDGVYDVLDAITVFGEPLNTNTTKRSTRWQFDNEISVITWGNDKTPYANVRYIRLGSASNITLLSDDC